MRECDVTVRADRENGLLVLEWGSGTDSVAKDVVADDDLYFLIGRRSDAGMTGIEAIGYEQVLVDAGARAPRVWVEDSPVKRWSIVFSGADAPEPVSGLPEIPATLEGWVLVPHYEGSRLAQIDYIQRPD